jgi:hypothetical protein
LASLPASAGIIYTLSSTPAFAQFLPGPGASATFPPGDSVTGWFVVDQVLAADLPQWTQIFPDRV